MIVDPLDANIRLYQNRVTCPYCDWRDGDSSDREMCDGDTDIILCPNCENEIFVECTVSVTYSSFSSPKKV